VARSHADPARFAVSISFNLSLLGRRLAMETLNPDTAAADLTARMQLFCAAARYPVPPEQGLLSWAMATLMLAARPRPANPDSRLNVW
jgi:hypothetical protein